MWPFKSKPKKNVYFVRMYIPFIGDVKGFMKTFKKTFNLPKKDYTIVEKLFSDPEVHELRFFYHSETKMPFRGTVSLIENECNCGDWTRGCCGGPRLGFRSEASNPLEALPQELLYKTLVEELTLRKPIAKEG